MPGIDDREVANERILRRLWRIVGALAIAHVVLMFGSFALQRVAPLDAGRTAIVSDHVRWSMTKGFAGGYLTTLSFLLFVLVTTLLARLLHGDSEVSQWLATTIAATGSIYVAVTLAGELTNLAGALYDGHHSAPIATVAALDHAHWFALYLATAVLGLFTLAIASAVRVTGALPRWVCFSGFGVGGLCVLSVPAAGLGAVDFATAVWAIWFIGLAIAALQYARRLAPSYASASVAAGVAS